MVRLLQFICPIFNTFSIEITMKGILWLSVVGQVSPVAARYNPAKHLHVTLQFGVEYEPFAHLIGQKVYVRCYADCHNDKVQAVRVELPAEFRRLCLNKNPHITISHVDGVGPVESNEMLRTSYTALTFDETVETVVEFFQFDR